MGPFLPIPSFRTRRAKAIFTAVGALTAAVSLPSAGAAYPGAPLPPPPVGSYPASPETLQQWIDTQDLAKIRAHGWDVWQSITQPAGESGYPVWETWYSGHELFDLGPERTQGQRAGFRDFERPTQFHHLAAGAGSRTPADRPETVLAFNRYSPSLAHTIWRKGLYQARTLNRINEAFDARGTPVGARLVSTSEGAVDAQAICLKPVFQFIDGQRPTPVPYWAGISPLTSTNLANPEPHTWRQAVLVDPTGKLAPGSRHKVSFNAEYDYEATVVPLERFYYLRITQAEADNFSQFAAESGDDVGAGNLTDTNSVLSMVKAGNIALLTAMHVTTKENTNWTWQSFYWSPGENRTNDDAGKPPALALPWSSYDMVTAYFMAVPDNASEGRPWIAFNPYLETNLEGTAKMQGGVGVSWTGVDSNCMTCHRMAGWRENLNGPDPLTPPYVPSGFISPDDPHFFGGFTKLDFLWSLTRAQ